MRSRRLGAPASSRLPAGIGDYEAHRKLIPAGYMLKKVMPRPEWLVVDSVGDIYALSSCMSTDFADYINYWKHNGYWLFDSPAILKEIAESEQLDCSELTWFYYEVYAQEYDESSKQWSTFSPDDSFATAVLEPDQKKLQGFDVVTFSQGNTPECSPLSCNALATGLDVNEHCLLNSLEQAKQSLENGSFDNSEPGPFRIFAVYTFST